MSFTIGSNFEPTPVRGSSKYGTTGGCSASNFSKLGLPEDTLKSISQLGNLGLANGTWKSYKAGQDMLYKCSLETKRHMTLPLTEADILCFIDWLHRVKKLSIGTIKCYLAGIRQLHISKGIEPPGSRSALVKLVIKGIYNKEGMQKREKKSDNRQPITLNMLLLLKALIRKLEMKHCDKALVWTICTVAFAGAFRIHELLCKTESVFDPTHTLLTEDATLSTNPEGHSTLHIRLKCPKEARNMADTVVDVFESKSKTCPVTAFKRWQTNTLHKPKTPLFRWSVRCTLDRKKVQQPHKAHVEPVY